MSAPATAATAATSGQSPATSEGTGSSSVPAVVCANSMSSAQRCGLRVATAATVAPASNSGRSGPSSEPAPIRMKVRPLNVSSRTTPSLMASAQSASIVPRRAHLSSWKLSDAPERTLPLYGTEIVFTALPVPWSAQVPNGLTSMDPATARGTAGVPSLGSKSMAVAFSRPFFSEAKATAGSARSCASNTLSMCALYVWRQSFSLMMACASGSSPRAAATALKTSFPKADVERTPSVSAGKQTPGMSRARRVRERVCVAESASVVATPP
mmetsp:Transcript_3963/g.12414  ORF Transcript_3963/g.12414 Transcript_3963/m.12414 type:complete len:269 (+) Transcript_3963:348-1154(+)